MTKNNHPTHPKSYLKVLNEIKDKARLAKSNAVKNVNSELIQLYWSVGKIIDGKVKKENWGNAIIDSLVKDLQKEFKGSVGFAKTNLYLMIKFYQTFKSPKIVRTLSGKLSWSHLNLIVSKCDTPAERNFYLKSAADLNWSVRILEHQIDLKTFKRSKGVQSNFKKSLSKKSKNLISVASKDEYVERVRRFKV